MSVSDEEVSKFEEAEEAGTENGHLCTLILADRYVAALISVAGLSVLGRNQYGMLLLSNLTDEAKLNDISKIPEINTLIEVVGLQYNTNYTTEAERKTLRYGKLMILTDQNEEGSNFKSLLIRFFYTHWPHLLQLSFLEEFITPVVIATKGETKNSFFSFGQFEEWKVETPDSCAYAIKFYLGLGTNTTIEAKRYFSNIDLHRVAFKYCGPEDDRNMSKAFDPDALKQRREWITHHMNECAKRKELGLQDKYLYTGITKVVTLSEFINLEYVWYARFDIARSIPNFIDGFVPGQRKVLFTCCKRNDKHEIRVAQLSGSVAETAEYHQSDHSLCEIIYKMAQNYVGSNNINLLIPFGQFGTRLMGGKDCADESYYIHTMMSTLTRSIFHPHDDSLLSYNSYQNQKIEPQCFIPVIPMILVNGSEGTGIGWSTNIPNHDPHQIIRCLRNMIAGGEPEELSPYYRNFRGNIQAVANASFISIGCLAIIEGDKIEITELPIGTWTSSYKESVLEQLLTGSDTTKPIITEYKEFNTDTTVRFVISFVPGEFNKLQNEIGGFYRVFKLTGIIKTDNMHAFDGSNTLRRYEKANDILKEFYNLRLSFYVKRKEYWEKKLTAEADKLSNQVRFILAKTENSLVVENKARKTIIDELIQLGYRADPVNKWKQENGIEASEGERDEFENLSSEEKNDVRKFDYLLNMSMWMLTEEMKNQLINKREAKLAELIALKSKSEYQLWLDDLDELEKKLNLIQEKERINSSKSVDSKELYPSEDGINVEFKVSDEFVEQYCV